MTSAPSIPAHAKVLVIGGGPGGSMSAILLAREGFDVVVLEREKFPRYHIGESLLTSAIPVLKFVGLYERMEAHGFTRKHGGFFTLKDGAEPGHIDFREVSEHRHSYQVIRSEFDHLLLQYAAEVGATVVEETSVSGVTMDGDRPVSAQWQHADGTTGEISFDYLIDASGVSGVMSTKVLHNRKVQPAFRNIAVGSYWKDYTPYSTPDGKVQEGEFYMEALRDGTGWVWTVPLHDGTLSVGVVVHADRFKVMRDEADDLEAVYAKGLSQATNTTKMLAGATKAQPVKVWRDFSYVADSFGGPNYRMVGDAAAFIDPLFSTGVHLAFLGALSAAATVSGQLRGEIDGDVALEFHDQCIRKAYVRFAVIVSGMYKQIHRQDEVVLYGIDKQDFQAAFGVILPLVSGRADMAATSPADTAGEVEQTTIGKAVDFTLDMMQERAQLNTQNPAAKLFIEKAGVHEDLTADMGGAVGGRYIRLEHGRLGLAEVGQSDREQLQRSAEQMSAELVEAARG